MIGKIVTVTIDRPIGAHHHQYAELCYPINYGYVSGIMSGDGEEMDAYVLGVDTPIEEFTGNVVAIIHRLDDVENKLVVAPCDATFEKEKIKELTSFQERYFNIKIEV